MPPRVSLEQLAGAVAEQVRRDGCLNRRAVALALGVSHPFVNERLPAVRPLLPPDVARAARAPHPSARRVDLAGVAEAVIFQVRADGYFSRRRAARAAGVCRKTLCRLAPLVAPLVPADVRRSLVVRAPSGKRVSDEALVRALAEAVRGGCRPRSRELAGAVGIARGSLLRRLPALVPMLPVDVSAAIGPRLKRPAWPAGRRRPPPGVARTEAEAMLAVHALRDAGRPLTVEGLAAEMGAGWQTARRLLARLRGRLPADVVLPPSVRRVSE
jgi:hypothetical protein